MKVLFIMFISGLKSLAMLKLIRGEAETQLKH